MRECLSQFESANKEPEVKAMTLMRTTNPGNQEKGKERGGEGR